MVTTPGAVHVTLTGVTNPVHILYATSYLRWLASRTTVVLRPLGFGSFLGRPPVTIADVAEKLPDGIALVDRPPERTERRLYLAVGAPGIKPWLRQVRSGELPLPRVVVVDEGLGTYGTLGTRRDAWRRQGGRGPWPTVRAIAVTGAARLLTSTRWATYRRTPAGWLVNPRVAAEFRRYGHRDPATVGTQCVFLTQPWIALGAIASQTYHDQLRRLAAQCAARGQTMAIHPHPSERPETYAPLASDGITVLDNAVPAELDPVIINAAAVLGGPSTALINLAAIFGVPAQLITMPDLERIETRLSASQRDLLAAFVTTST